jgi:hypothetical protein
MIILLTSIKNGGIEQNPTTGRDANTQGAYGEKSLERCVEEGYGLGVQACQDLEEEALSTEPFDDPLGLIQRPEIAIPNDSSTYQTS